MLNFISFTFDLKHSTSKPQSQIQHEKLCSYSYDSLSFFENKYNEKHKIHKVVLYKVVYFVIYDLQLFKSVILYPKSYVSVGSLKLFVPCHQDGNPQRAEQSYSNES